MHLEGVHIKCCITHKHFFLLTFVKIEVVMFSVYKCIYFFSEVPSLYLNIHVALLLSMNTLYNASS
jgi:hypothetical protein